MSSTDLENWLDGRDGIAHTADLYRAGFAQRAIADAERDGLVRRVRRSWIYTRRCDASHLAAATFGGRITCVSAALLRGLWVLGDHDGRTHIAVSRNAHAESPHDDIRFHWGGSSLPRTARVLVVPVADMLVHAAACLPFESALTIAESAIRTGAVSREELALLPGSSAAFVRVRRAASELSDSGLETLVRERLARLGIVMRQQVRLLGHRVDGLVGDRLVIQVDGRDHLSPRQAEIDRRHDAALQAAGYIVLRYGYWRVIEEWASIEAQILLVIAQGRHLAV